ncbi:LysR substrate-binding domain-containing protein [Phaeovulum sp.]|uniref:LysR substrate-binding domain-containing protein n=1 Tax=Phaeovulum sp. TaxID=2934796 RepID=UPI00272F43E4|nr:LysR substrate-binding domain-containing protein [Phaeovulum sp.]MDP1668406.1 LysR substrate-binding domain-containing protein [Phaeovulum sp.]MDP2185986.1 LysR substrate-binding domain-containing protein [Xanthomonadales bacterium]MDZ4120099.1 LysR substrate-binding domain-containing protein [Phaeovulum sp.]
MEIDWLEDFLALSSAGIFAKAADARNVSHSAFTRRIKNLEYWVGTPLFDRSVHPVVLTPAGEAFRQTAHSTISQLATARTEAKGLAKREGEVLEFTALHTLAISFFPPWISGIARSLGTLRSRVMAENFSGCVEAVLSGASDFMLCYHHASVPMIADDKRYPSVKIADDRLVAVCAPGPDGTPLHSLDNESFPFLAYSRESFLGKMTDGIVDRVGLRDACEFRYENSVAEALKTACVEGLGVAWLPQLCVQRELDGGRLLRLGDKGCENQISIRLYRSMERSRSDVERFWSFVRSSYE